MRSAGSVTYKRAALTECGARVPQYLVQPNRLCCYAVVTTMTNQIPTDGLKPSAIPKPHCTTRPILWGGGSIFFWLASLRPIGKYVAILIPI